MLFSKGLHGHAFFLSSGCVWFSECTGMEGNGRQLLTKHFPWLLSETIMGRTRQHILIRSSLKILPGLVYEKRAREHLEWRSWIIIPRSWRSSVRDSSYTKRKASNKAFSSPKAGEGGDFFPFVCNFTLKNYHIKRASSCSGCLTKLWVSSAFAFVLPCRIDANRQTEVEVYILSSYASSSEVFTES